MWVNLTSHCDIKDGAAIVGHLYGVAKTAAKTLDIEAICKDRGVDLILKRLDEDYAVDKLRQLETELVDFLDYCWKK